MIEFREVIKRYGDKKALDQVSFKINEGEIFGLIGHNGAGKSTTIKILVSIIEATAGEVYVNNRLLTEHRDEIKKHIGYVADSPDIFLRLRANEYWELMKAAYEITDEVYEERLNYFVDLFDLKDVQEEFIESFSHGMRQKTFLVGALLSNPDIWILDEPMTGLDPQAQYDLKEMMKQHAAEGKTVLFSTHALEVAQELCDRLVILRRGKVIYQGTFQDLQNQNPGQSLETIYLDMAGRKADEREAAGQSEFAAHGEDANGVEDNNLVENKEKMEAGKTGEPRESEMEIEMNDDGLATPEQTKEHFDQLTESVNSSAKERDTDEL